MAFDASDTAMSLRRIRRGAFLAIAGWIVSASIAAASDETFEHARELYASAAYDEALAVLDRLDRTTTDATSISEYRVFCLLALDRGDEARKNIEGILRQNPKYVPVTDQMSPRVEKVFRDVRRQSLPKIVLERYAAAKAAFERKEPQSQQMFEGVLALLDDPDVQQTPSLTDLRTVVSAFRDLTVATAAAQRPEPPVARSPSVAASSKVYTQGDADVVPPVAQSQVLPRWTPPAYEPVRDFSGTLEVLIDASGAVLSAAIRHSVHPAYNNDLVRAARGWKFAPARRNGVAVRYLKVIEIQLVRNPS